MQKWKRATNRRRKHRDKNKSNKTQNSFYKSKFYRTETTETDQRRIRHVCASPVCSAEKQHDGASLLSRHATPRLTDRQDSLAVTGTDRSRHQTHLWRRALGYKTSGVLGCLCAELRAGSRSRSRQDTSHAASTPLHSYCSGRLTSETYRKPSADVTLTVCKADECRHILSV